MFYKLTQRQGRPQSEEAKFCKEMPGECSIEDLFFGQYCILENIVSYLMAQLLGYFCNACVLH